MQKSTFIKGNSVRGAAHQPRSQVTSGVSLHAPLQLKPVVQMFHPLKEHINKIFHVKLNNSWVICTYKGMNKNEQYVFTANESGETVTINYDQDEAIRPSFGMISLPSTQSSEQEKKQDEMELSYESSEYSEDSEDSSSDDEDQQDNYSNLKNVYEGWNPNQQFQQIDTPFGVSNVKHNRKSAYITTNVKQYPNTKVKVDYKDIIRALRLSKLSDPEIAEILLNGDNSKIDNNTFKRAASMLSAIVYLAEQWRKQGAVKIYRAILRAIIEGKFTFDDFLKVFEFIVSAKAGREQVSRIQQALKGKLEYKELEETDQTIIGGMSPLWKNDLDSDDDTRDLKEKDFKYGRENTSYWEKSKKEKLNTDDIVVINGRLYNLNHPSIRGAGHCLWDTMEFLGINQSTLQNAAGNTYGQFFFADAIDALLNSLSSLGVNIQIQLDVFTYSGDIDNLNSGVYGTSGSILYIGLVYDEKTGLGHYIPAINMKK